MTSKTERITILDSELAALREKLAEFEAKAGAHDAELESLRAVIKDADEARSKLESDVVSLQTAASEAAAAAVEHAKVKEEVIFLLRLLHDSFLMTRSCGHSSPLLKQPMLMPMRRFKNLQSSMLTSPHP